VKLNLGCGNDLLKGYINCDRYNINADRQIDATDLVDFADNSVDEIYASHLIEHFDFYQAQDVLREWNRALKPGGLLVIETPDLLESCRKFVESDQEVRSMMYGHFFAKPWIAGEIHKFLYTKEQLEAFLMNTGFFGVLFMPPTRYLDNPNIRVRCVKNFPTKG
jgi:predicted SAM-dependent methyltransferase